MELTFSMSAPPPIRHFDNTADDISSKREVSRKESTASLSNRQLPPTPDDKPKEQVSILNVIKIIRVRTDHRKSLIITHFLNVLFKTLENACLDKQFRWPLQS